MTTVIPARKFRPGILKAQDLSLSEIQNLVIFLGNRERRVARRFRALLLRALGGSSADVNEKIGVSRRQVFRWFSWFKSHGGRGLLNEFRGRFRQCGDCGLVGEVGLEFSPNNYTCAPCRRSRMADFRLTNRGRRRCQLYNRSPARARSNTAYRRSDAGRAMLRGQYLRRMLRELRAQSNA